jgi:4-hydroxy-tetrahydrodipicolinate synthase
LFTGLSAFPLTPADSDGIVDTEAYATTIDRLVDAGVASISILGSTGAYAYLDRSERSHAVAAAVEVVAGRVPLIVGTGSLRTSWVRELARDAERMGASGLLLAPVSYTPLTADECFGLYEAAASTTGLPLCVYNNPSTTRFTFSDDLLARVAALPAVAAIKMPLPANGDFAGELARLRPRIRNDVAIGYSGDWGAADALLAGSDAWFSVVAGLLPSPALRLTRAARAGDAAATRRLDAAFAPLWNLFRRHGSFRVMYVIADVLGLGAGVPPLPIRPLPADVRGDVERALQHLPDTGGV